MIALYENAVHTSKERVLPVPPFSLNHLLPCERHLREALDRHGFGELTLRQEFTFQQGANNTWLRSYWAENNVGTSARCALIGGPKSEIVNLMIFPKNTTRSPIFASEIILFGSKVHVAVVDHQTPDVPSPLSGELSLKLSAVGAKYRELLDSGGELPAWAQTHFTPDCVYSRPKDGGQTGNVVAAFIDYLDLWLDKWLPQQDGSSGGLDALNSYLHHHVVNTPGRPFLGRFFGVDWAERYLRYFMYAPILPEQNFIKHPS